MLTVGIFDPFGVGPFYAHFPGASLVRYGGLALPPGYFIDPALRDRAADPSRIAGDIDPMWSPALAATHRAGRPHRVAPT